MSDLIKREDAIHELCRLTNDSDMPHDWHVGVSASISALHRIPSADRPQGEWIEDKHKNIWDMDVDCYKCSVCGRYAIHRSLIMDTEGLYFCPNCGAKMKGADDE